MKIKTALVIPLLLGVLTVMAQQAPSAYAGKYAREYSVGIEKRNHTTIAIKKGQLEITEEISSSQLYMDKRASEFAQMTVEYEPEFSDIEDLSAYTLAPERDKDNYQKIKVKDIDDRKLISDDVFHDGTRAKVFTFPSVQKGAITVMNYTRRILNPYLVGIEVFQKHYITESQEFVIQYDEDIDLDIRYVNCSESDFDHSIENKRGNKIYTWRLVDQEKITDEEHMPAMLHFAPHIVYRIKSYSYKGDTIPILRNVEDLHQNYRTFVARLEDDRSPELNRLTDSLVDGLTDSREKAAAIYKWTQDNVKYIAFEDGYGGFVPRTPSTVFERRYGDCKDMSCLMVAMLKQADLPAHFAWIGTRDIPYRYNEVPSSLTDNHMIAALELDGEQLFLDATSENLPFAMPSAFIQGKEALIDYGADSFKVAQVPVVPASENLNSDSLYLYMEDGTLKGSGTRTYYGYYLNFLNRLDNRQDKRYTEKQLENDVSKGSNKCSIEIIKVKNAADHGEVTYSISIPDYAYYDDKHIYLNLNMENLLTELRLKPERKFPLEFDHTFSFQREFVFQIPEGFTVDDLPDSDSYHADGLTASVSYTKHNDQVIYQLRVAVNKLTIEPDQFEDFNAMINFLAAIYSESIIISKVE